MAVSKTKVTRHLSQDPILKEVIGMIPFPKLNTKEIPLSHALIESIVYQQLSIKAAAVIYQRLLEKFKDQKLDLKKLVKMETESLRAVGLSYAKADYMRNIAQYFLLKENQNIDWHTMPEDELVTRLTVIKGVGVWTVQMTMISPLGKADVFPSLDLGVQQSMIKLYNLEGKGKVLVHQMNEIAQSWRPYRTYACVYLWKWKNGQ